MEPTRKSFFLFSVLFTFSGNRAHSQTQLSIMKSTFLTLLATCLVWSSALAAKPDLAPDASLRIGVKHRVPAEECTRKSKNGDRLSMHYTGTLRKDDSQFDSSVGRAPFEFVIGVSFFACRFFVPYQTDSIFSSQFVLSSHDSLDK